MAGKAEIIEAIATGSNLSRRDAENAYNAFVNSVAAALRQGERVIVSGLGSFVVSERGARTGRNPKTGESIQIPASRVAKFKMGKEMKDSLNSKKS